MKELHDGSAVSINTPTKMVNGKRYLLEVSELAAKANEDTFDSNRRAKKIKQRAFRRDRGSIQKQLNFIAKNGLQAYKNRIAQLKQQHGVEEDADV